jgi:hypothetical protein
MPKTIEVAVTYQRCNASGEQCVIRHRFTDLSKLGWGHTHPEWVQAQLGHESLHQEFLRKGWYQKQFEYDPN